MIQLLDVQYTKDNTRYFCINTNLLSTFEHLDISEVVSLPSLVPWNPKKETNFTNPFVSKITKHDEVEVTKSDESKSLKYDEAEVMKNDYIKTSSSTSRSNNTCWVEVIKDDINNIKIKTKHKEQKNNNKDLLLPFIKNSTTRVDIYIKYSIDRLTEVINAIKLQKPTNPWGFIRWALENDIVFKNNTNKPVFVSYEHPKEDSEVINERNRILEEKKAYLEWKNNNKEEYTKIFEWYKIDLWKNISHAIQLNIKAEIEAKKYILQHYIDIWE